MPESRLSQAWFQQAPLCACIIINNRQEMNIRSTLSGLKQKFWLVSTLLTLTGQNIWAQASAGNYSFTQTSGTYTPITGGIVIGTGIQDSYQSGAIVLTPAFTFCGVSHDTAYVTSNGLISFEGTAGPGTTQYNGIANGGGSGRLLCPFNADLVGSSAAGAAPEIRYELVGNEHVFQWKDISRAPATADRFSFQARLNTVTGVITYVYTVTSVGTATNRQPVIGIRTDNTAGNWQSRLVDNNGTSSWAASAPATVTGNTVRFTSNATNPKQPVNGQTYIYTPPPPCATVPAPAVVAINAAPVSICLSGNATLSLAAPMPLASGLSYQWQRSTTTAAGPYTTVANTTVATYTAATNVSSYYRCRVLCNNDSISPYWVSAASAQVVVLKPGAPVVTNGSRCGPGSVALSAVLPAGATALNWYAAATGGTALATGTTYNTPYITTNTTYYVAAAIGTCEDARVPVTATVNASPIVTKTVPAVACNNAITAITLTPPVPPYPSYNWTPTAGLYTDAAATVPYTGGSAATVYMKTGNVGTQTYYMMAGDPAATTGCTFADTIRIWSQPGSVAIKAVSDTICITGISILLLDTISGYYPGTIRWQDSIPGTSASYTNIPGATAVTYTTPNLTVGQNRYYKALISADGKICQSPEKYVVVANPVIVNAPDSFNCGPGTVTLTAQVGGNSQARWYSSPTATLPVGYGSPWTTPYLGTTTTYYVAAGSGAAQPSPAFIGTGTGTVSGTYSPYYRSSWGQKVQYLIRASEMVAAGFTAGYITAAGFDVTTAGTAAENYSLSMKLTTLNALPATFQTGMQSVYAAASYTPVANTVNDHVFQAPFYWNGTSNIILEKCSNNGNTGTSTTVRTTTGLPAGTTIYSTANVTTHCANPTSGITTTTARPNIRITMKRPCESAREEVIAYIHPKPVVNLGPDINKCVDAGAVEVLDAGVQPNAPHFLWDNGSTSQVRGVNTSGTYTVKVTNQYTCATIDTINVTLRRNPVVTLGNDTTVCNGTELALNAGGDGISYMWNTGETTQIIEIDAPGTYNVFVTNNLGCVKADTIRVNMAGEAPTISGINISNNGVNTFHFTAVNPQNVIGYEWDFGDGSPHSYQAAPTHTYPGTGNYVVVLKLSSSCGFLNDTTSAHIVGINPVAVSNDELLVYPNPSSATATILNKGALKMEKVEIYTTLGQVVYTAKADSKDKHTMQLGGLAAGIYTIQVYTDKGTVARKLEVLH